MPVTDKVRKLPSIHHQSFVFAPFPYELPAIRVRSGTFYQQYATPGRSQQPLFKDLNLTIGHPTQEQWAVVGPAGSGKTTLLELLRGRHVCEPASALQYPGVLAAAALRHLPSDPLPLIQYLPATGREGTLAAAAGQGAYLSARYESGRDASDLILSDYLTGNLFHLNPDPAELEKLQTFTRKFFYQHLLTKMHLTELADQPLNRLSNGQARRARIARALVPRPAVLLLDEPFLGLDPVATAWLSKLLRALSHHFYLTTVCAFEDDHRVPEFITHILYLNSRHEIVASGPRKEVQSTLRAQGYRLQAKTRRKVAEGSMVDEAFPQSTRNDWSSQKDAPAAQAEEDSAAAERPDVIEMAGVKVRYGDVTALGAWNQEVDGEQRPGLRWRVRQGERWGVFGANGAGKTTLLSLINSDHPQAYAQPIKVFGRGRLATAGEPALSLFELQERIGQASPEIHNFFPRHLSVRQTLESAWAETFRAAPQLTHEADEAVDATLRWFQPLLDPACADDVPGALSRHAEKLGDIRSISAYRDTSCDWAEEVRFGELDFAAQRIALFLRAVVRKCDLVVLDEAFGGLSQAARIRCMMWLAYGERRVVAPPDRRGVVRKRPTSFDRAADLAAVAGLEPRQTLLCVAHRRDDVPPLLNRYILLPPDGGRATGAPPRTGSFDFHGPVWKVGTWWETMWQLKKARQ